MKAPRFHKMVRSSGREPALTISRIESLNRWVGRACSRAVTLSPIGGEGKGEGAISVLANARVRAADCLNPQPICSNALAFWSAAVLCRFSYGHCPRTIGVRFLKHQKRSDSCPSHACALGGRGKLKPQPLKLDTSRKSYFVYRKSQQGEVRVCFNA